MLKGEPKLAWAPAQELMARSPAVPDLEGAPIVETDS